MNILGVVSILFIFTSLLPVIRIIAGPTPHDRLIGLNLIVAQTTCVMALLSVLYNRSIYLDVVLVYAILGFISVIAISKYLGGREVHE